MNLTDLLNDKKIDPKQVAVIRHKPWEKALNKVLPWLAAERPELFNAYQQTQNSRVEATFLRAKYLASFLGRKPGKALFVGLYKINGSTVMGYEACRQQPSMVELIARGMGRGDTSEKPDTIRWFDLVLDDSFYPEWKGRLVVNWPPGMTYCRWAHANDFPVLAIHESSALDAAMPSWDALVLPWDQLRLIPVRWQDELKRWRGVYYIFDEADGKGYVGSATGEENIGGRWVDEYGKSGHGGNKLLAGRDPKNFRFSMLQLVAHDLDADAVIKLEASWKKRLHTHSPFGLNDN